MATVQEARDVLKNLDEETRSNVIKQFKAVPEKNRQQAIDRIVEKFSKQKPTTAEETTQDTTQTTPETSQQPEEQKGFIERTGEKISKAILPKEFTQFMEEFSASGKPAAERLKSAQNIQTAVREFGQAYGVGVGMASLLNKWGALKQIPVAQGLASTPEAKQAFEAIRKQNALKAMARHAIEGGAAAQVFDYKNLKDRAASTALASVASILIPMGVDQVASGINTATRSIRAYRAKVSADLTRTTTGSLKDPRMPSLKKIRETIAETNKNMDKVVTNTANEIKAQNKELAKVNQQVKERVDSVKDRIKAYKEQKRYEIKSSTKETVRQLNKSADQMDEQLTKATDITTKEFQSKVSRFNGKNGQIYGKELDKISDSMDGMITLKDGDDILKRAKEFLKDNAGIEESQAYQQILKLQGKYGSKQSVQTGSGEIVQIPRDQNAKIPFKELLNDMRSIWKQSYKGSRMTEDGIPGAVLQKEFGEFVSTLPGGKEFKKLQEAYRPIISYMNRANEVLKPYKGDAYRKEAYLLLERVVKGDAAPADNDLIAFLENGTEKFAKGTGATAARSRQIVDNIRIVKDEAKRLGFQEERKLMNITERGVKKLAKINELEKGAYAKAQKQSEKIINDIQAKAEEEIVKYRKRLSSLGERQKTIESLNTKRRMMQKFVIVLTKIVGGMAGAYIAARGGAELMETLRESK